MSKSPTSSPQQLGTDSRYPSPFVHTFGHARFRFPQGRQPFHNFTVRRLYRPGKKGSKRKVTRLTQESETLLDLEGGGDDPLSVPPSKYSDTDASASDTTADSDAGSLGVEEGAQNLEVGSSEFRAVSDRSGLHADTSEDAEKFSDTGGPLDAASNHPDAAGDDSEELGRDSDAYGYADDDPDAHERSDGDSNTDERWDDDSDAFGREGEGDPSDPDYPPSATDKYFEERRESEELELAYDEEEEDDEGNWVERRGPTAQWLLETPPEDRIGPSHYRRILGATCTGLEPLGKSRVVRIHFEGESFMLHQVRRVWLACGFGFLEAVRTMLHQVRRVWLACGFGFCLKQLGRNAVC